MKNHFLYITLFLASLLQTTFAQNNSSDSTNKSISLNEVVISVNKSEETKKTVAQQVEVIDTKTIVSLQAQTTAEVLAKSGLQVQMSQQGGGSPTLRGFEASRILLVIDGVRMNNLIYRAGHLQDIIKTDVNMLDRVEVLYGPASNTYGSDALGGVIHLSTKKPILAFGEKNKLVKVNLMTRYASASNEITYHADVNLANRKFASLTSFSSSSFGDLLGGTNQNPFFTGSYGERPYYVKRIDGKDSLMENSNRYRQVGTAYAQQDVIEKMLFQQTEHLSHAINLQYSNSTDVPRYDRLTDPKGTGLKYAEWYYGPQSRMLAAYDLNHDNQASAIQSTHFGLSYQALEESRHNRSFGSIYRSNRIENVQVIGANLDFKRIQKSHVFRFGADAQFNMLQSTANKQNIVADTSGALDTRFPDGDNTMNNLGLYYSHTWQINDQLVLTDGFRVGMSMLHSTLVDTALLFHLPYTNIDQQTPVYSGSIGLIHSPSDDLKLSLLLSTGYRVPNVDDMSKIFGSAPGMVIVPNKNIKPEQTISYEAGITKIFNGKMRWENTVYYTSYKDVAVVDVFQLNGQDSMLYDGTMSKVYANQNKQAAYIYGASSALKAQLNNQFMLNAGLNYTYGRIKTDSSDAPLDHIAPMMARMGLTYTHEKFSSEFFLNYSAAKKLKDYYLNGEDNEQYATSMGMPAWMTLNLHASYQAHKMLNLQAGIDNIFDTQYRTFASGMNAPGRSLFVALRASF